MQERIVSLIFLLLLNQNFEKDQGVMYQGSDLWNDNYSYLIWPMEALSFETSSPSCSKELAASFTLCICELTDYASANAYDLSAAPQNYSK